MLTKITDEMYLDLSKIESIYKDFDGTCYVVKPDGSSKNLTQGQFKALCDVIDKRNSKLEEAFKIRDTFCSRETASSLSSLNPEDASAMRLKGIE